MLFMETLKDFDMKAWECLEDHHHYCNHKYDWEIGSHLNPDLLDLI